MEINSLFVATDLNGQDPAISPGKNNESSAHSRLFTKELLQGGEQNQPKKMNATEVLLPKQEMVQKDIINSPYALNTELTKKFPFKLNIHLNEFGKLLGKGSNAIEQSEALSYLTGLTRIENPKQLNAFIINSPFIEKALAEGANDFMQKKFSINELAHMLGIKDEIIDRSKAIGINLEERVTPVEFLKSLSIDPHKIVATIHNLRDRLLRKGIDFFTKKKESHLDSAPHVHDKNKTKNRVEIPTNEQQVSVINPDNFRAQKFIEKDTSHETLSRHSEKNIENLHIENPQIEKFPEFTKKKHSSFLTEKNDSQLFPLQVSPEKPDASISKNNFKKIDGIHEQSAKNIDLHESKSINHFNHNPLNHNPLEKIVDKEGTQRLTSSFLQSDRLVDNLAKKVEENSFALADPRENEMDRFADGNLAVTRKQMRSAEETILKELREENPLLQVSGVNEELNENPITPLRKSLDELRVANMETGAFSPENPLSENQILEKIVTENPTLNQVNNKTGTNHEFSLKTNGDYIDGEYPLSSVEQVLDFENPPTNRAKEKSFTRASLFSEEEVESTLGVSNSGYKSMIPSNSQRFTMQSNSDGSEFGSKNDQFYSQQKISFKPEVKNIQDVISDISNFEVNYKPQNEISSENINLMSDVEENVIREKVITQTKMLIGEGGGEARVDLSGEGFGELNLTVDLKGGDVSVKIISDNKQIRDLLVSDIHDLKDSLDIQKLNLINVEMSDGNEGRSYSFESNEFFQNENGSYHSEFSKISQSMYQDEESSIPNHIASEIDHAVSTIQVRV